MRQGADLRPFRGLTQNDEGILLTGRNLIPLEAVNKEHAQTPLSKDGGTPVTALGRLREADLPYVSRNRSIVGKLRLERRVLAQAKVEHIARRRVQRQKAEVPCQQVEVAVQGEQRASDFGDG